MKLTLVLLALMIADTARAASPIGPQGVTLQGTILTPQGTPEVGTNVKFTIDVRSPGTENCLLYRETHTLNMGDSGGNFSLILGLGTRTGSTFDATSTLAQAFTNTGTFTGLSCAVGSSYSPFTGQQRNIFLTFDDGTSVQTLSSAMNAMAVPYALNADSLQGYQPTNFLLLNTAPDLTQANLESVFSNTNYPRLTTLLSVPPSNYLSIASDGAVTMPTTTQDPSSPATGQIWFNSSAKSFNYYDGTSVQILSTQQNLTSVSGNAITSGTISGTTAVSTSGNLQTTGSMSASQLFLYDHAGAGPGYIGFKTPANIATSGASYIMTWPTSAGASGQILVTDGAGNLSWGDRSAGSVVSVSGSAPISIGGTAQAPVISIAQASTTANGAVTLATSGGTTPGTVVEATDARLTDARIPLGAAGGDLSGTYPYPAVARIRGVGIATTTPSTPGTVLRFDGSNWAPSFLSMFDLRSSITGSQTFTAGCLNNQTLTWTSAADNLSCTNIQLSDTQVTYGSESANTFLAAPSGSAGAPTYRNLTAADLPSGGYNSTYFKNGANAFGASGVLGTADSNSLILQTNATTRMTILPAGNVGVGIGTPSAALQIKAGTNTLAPLMLTAGTNLSSALVGAVEFDGTSLFYTDSTSTRRTLATTSSGSAATFSQDVTLSGAGTGLSVSNNESVGGTLSVTGGSTFTGSANFNGGAAVGANQNFTMTSGTGTFTQNYTGTTTTANTINGNSVTTANVSAMNGNGLTSGNILLLTSTSTAAATGQTGLNIAISGANAAASVTRYGLQSSVTATGTTNTNIAGNFTATGGTTNYGLKVNASGGTTNYAATFSGGFVGIGNTAPVATLDVTGHINNSGASANMGACGTTPSITGNDTRGQVTIGTGTVTSCVINFQTAFTTAPYCTVTWSTAASATGIGVSATTSALTVLFTASSPSQKFIYHCLQ